ncbi:MAG: S-methyl-5'-thioadenosine phosphorylase [Oligoflexales bacterium]
MGSAKLAVIGGSGLYEMAEAKLVKEHNVETPFGAPSAPVAEVEIGGRAAFFLPRHGIGHTLLPSEVNYRANIFALKKVGATHVLAVSAVGIMKEDITRGDLVIPDQIFDRTKGVRESTFFGRGIVGHVPFADPFCNHFSGSLAEAALQHTKKLHRGGTYVCMEGPQFSTRAESHRYRSSKPSVIGMTAIPEAKLAREAELCYAMLCLTTDYDCWKEDEDVDIAAILKTLKENATLSKKVIQSLAATLTPPPEHFCQTAAKHAIITNPKMIPAERKKELSVLFGKYLD